MVVGRVRAVEGYGAELPENWKERVPLKHKEAALLALSQVDAHGTVEAAEGYSLTGEEETVRLEAARLGWIAHVAWLAGLLDAGCTMQHRRP